LPGDIERFTKGERPTLNALYKGLALDQFKDERAQAVGFFEPMDSSDIRMVQGRKHARFTVDRIESAPIDKANVMQNLNGHIPSEFDIPCPVDLSHSSTADQWPDPIVVQSAAFQRRKIQRGERQTARRGFHEVFVSSCLLKKRFNLAT
jgi:hypothetical protein